MFKYEEIVADVTEKINTGELASGDQLPSMSELRQEYQASYGSIRTAMVILRTQGLIEGRHGVGVFIK